MGRTENSLEFLDCRISILQEALIQPNAYNTYLWGIEGHQEQAWDLSKF